MCPVERETGEAFAQAHQLEARGTLETMRLIGQVIGDFVLGLSDEFSGGGWRGSAEVGNKVGDGEVGFVTDRGYDGELRCEDGARQALGVEGGQVFKGSATAGNDDEVDEARAVELGEGGFDFGRGGITLHGDGVKQNVEAGVAAADDVEEIANDGASGRGDNADGAGKGRQGALAFGVEEAFGFKARLELFEGELERSGADGLHRFSDELHLSALLVDADTASDENVEAIFRAEAEEQSLAAEQDDGELGVSILEREVNVARWCGAVV